MKGAGFNESAEPGDKACINFNNRTCATNVDHPSQLNICKYCLYTKPVPPHRTILPQEVHAKKRGMEGLRQDNPVHPRPGRDHDTLTLPTMFLNSVPIAQPTYVLGTATGVAGSSHKPQCQLAPLLRLTLPLPAILTHGHPSCWKLYITSKTQVKFL